CVPPSTSGTPQRRFRTPNSALAAAIRKSHHAASSIPPAKQYPLIAPIVGLPGSSAANPIGPALSVYGCSSSVPPCSSSPPDHNDSGPAPVTTSTRASSSAANASIAVPSASAVSPSTAVWTSGRV